jgi:hypothetical protein
MAKEASLWALLKEHLPKGAHFQRIETGGTGKGVPDLNYCYQTKEVWIELKSIEGLKSTLTPFQIAWLYNRYRAGGNAFVLMRKNNSKKKQIKLFSPCQGMTFEEFAALNWKTESLITLSIPYKWEELFKMIELYSD